MPQMMGAGPDPECEMCFSLPRPPPLAAPRAGRPARGVTSSQRPATREIDCLRGARLNRFSTTLNLGLGCYVAEAKTSPRRKMGVFFCNLSLYEAGFPLSY